MDQKHLKSIPSLSDNTGFVEETQESGCMSERPELNKACTIQHTSCYYRFFDDDNLLNGLLFGKDVYVFITKLARSIPVSA